MFCLHQKLPDIIPREQHALNSALAAPCTRMRFEADVAVISARVKHRENALPADVVHTGWRVVNPAFTRMGSTLYMYMRDFFAVIRHISEKQG